MRRPDLLENHDTALTGQLPCPVADVADAARERWAWSLSSAVLVPRIDPNTGRVIP